MAITIDELQVEIEANSTAAAQSVDALSKSLTMLRAAAKGGVGLTTTAKQLQALSQTVQDVQVPTQKIAELVSAIKPLETIGKSNLGSSLNQLKKIPEITNNLDDAKLSAFAAKIQQVTTAILPLSTEMEKVSAGFSRLPANIQKAINANAKLTNSNQKTAKSYGVLGTGISAIWAKFTLLYIGMRRIARVISDWIGESNDYVENLNLFTVAMGEYAGEAQKYAESVGDAMGIDPSAWMRNQGVFMTLATGFGVVSNKAALMSQNLTQLGYDLSSFFNISVEDSMQKLQSGISGELEPLRRLGYDLSQAKLEEIALANGIKTKVGEMNQAQKAQLRYYAIMTQVTTAQGDMARTLNAPANQLRILKAQLTQASRALGNIFIPALNAVLPYAIAFLKAIRWIANELANLFGFTLPEIDYSGVSTGADEVTDTLGDATDAANKFKSAMLGIDELNVLNNNNAATAASAGVSAGDLGLNLPTYDFLANLAESKASKIFEGWKKDLEPTMAWLKDNWEDVLTTVKTIGAVLIAWKIGKGVAGIIETLTKNPLVGEIALALSIAAITWKLATDANLGSSKQLLYAALNTALSGMLGALIFKSLLGGVIGLAFGFAISIVAISFQKGTFGDWDSGKTFRVVLGAILGLAIGAMFGGVVGAVIGLVMGASIALATITFKDALAEKGTANKIFKTVIGGMLGLIIGGMFGGIPGAVIGLIVGAGFSFAYASFESKLKDLTSAKNLWKVALSAILGAVIGFAFGGVVGAVVGLVFGLALSFNLSSVDFDGEDRVKAAFSGGGRKPTTSAGKVTNWASGYATGGYPDSGDVFVANESGPEMVGRIGSRTAVANGDQIVTAIRAGVYDAVTAAMGSGSGSGASSYKFEMDGREVATRVTKRQGSSGRMYGRQLA